LIDEIESKIPVWGYVVWAIVLLAVILVFTVVSAYRVGYQRAKEEDGETIDRYSRAIVTLKERNKELRRIINEPDTLVHKR